VEGKELRFSFSQKCRRMPANLLAHYWTFPDNIFFVTTAGIELYQTPTTNDTVSMVCSTPLLLNEKQQNYPSQNKSLVVWMGTRQKGFASLQRI
jgi:hypothetical protein